MSEVNVHCMHRALCEVSWSPYIIHQRPQPSLHTRRVSRWPRPGEREHISDGSSVWFRRPGTHVSYSHQPRHGDCSVIAMVMETLVTVMVALMVTPALTLHHHTAEERWGDMDDRRIMRGP